jgi:glycerol-3-phosphate dehydrogenase
VQALYPSVRSETFLEACGIADLIATCYGGRNRLVAQEWTKVRGTTGMLCKHEDKQLHYSVPQLHPFYS